jgi:superfamily II DNA or RNA helicase|tara:strand:- start:573 stop:2030 length:1458 start_codon:yes stop_codon:yes gene_type:complete
MLEIEKFNEVYLRIKCEPSIGRELAEFFSFTVPNAKFMPSVRNKMWDGKVRLYSPATGKIYIGLFPYIKSFCEKQGYDIVLKNNKFYGPVVVDRVIEKSLITKFVKTITPKGLKVRDYQLSAISYIINNERGLILSPTGSGKSFIIYALVRYYTNIMEDKKVLIVVPTTGLVEQMYSDFADYGWFPDEHCHKLYSGHDKITNKDVIISTWQSIYKMPKSYFNQFGATIVDEAHLAKAKSLTGIMTKLHDCKYRIGTTGTLDGTEIHQLVLEGIFGKCENVTTTSELIEKKYLSNLHIKCLVLEHPKEKRQHFDYAEEFEFLSVDEKRNKFIANLAKYESGNSLVLCRYISQLDILYEMISNDKETYKVYGNTPTQEREEVRRLVEVGNDIVIVASYGVFSTGINIKRLYNIVFASPYKSQIKVLQSLGRGLRVADDKDQLNVFDIVDDLTFKNKENFTLKHFRERINIYNSEQFEYDIISIPLKL